MAPTNSTGDEKSHAGGNILNGQNPIRFDLADPLPLFIVQTVIILSLCYAVNLLMYRLRQPKVVSEVLSGIILGPSILGQIPGFNDLIFPSESIPFLNLVSNLGLVLFLFLVGLELDPKLILKRAKYALGISIAGLVLPFIFSCGAAILLYRQFEQPTETRPSPSFGTFFLASGMAMSLTAFPILARILAEMQLMSTTVGFITVCSAAAVDIFAWVLVALLVSLFNSTTPIMPLYVVLMSIGWCVILVYIVRPILMSLVRLTHSEEEPSQKMIVITLVVVLTSSFATHIIGVHSIMGGFLVGLLIPHDSGFAEGLTRRIEDLVGVYFLPIFFACSGLKTEVGLLDNGLTWGYVIMVTLIAFVGKMLGCISAAKVNGMTWREALSIGFLMNCKGLVEYIVLNLAHDAGVLSDRVFVIMIAMCLLLTMIATPLVSYLYPVSYQKALEAKREAERKLKGVRSNNNLKASVDESPSSSQKRGFLSALVQNLRHRRGEEGDIEKERQGRGSMENTNGRLEGLDGIHIDAPNSQSVHGDDEDDVELRPGQGWKKRNSIMFCLDKTANAPGVMTLLQLFSGTSTQSRARSFSARVVPGYHEKGTGLTPKQQRNRHQGTSQPSIDISDPKGHHPHMQANMDPEYEINYSKVYAIRLLHITERTSAAMLTASRCMDRLYKDTVMMMVMAFAKLCSVPLKPLVAISTDTAQSTVAQDVLDRAEDLNVGWIVYPWNSSHLTDLPASEAGYPTGGSHLNPGIMISMANTAVTSASGAITSTPGTPSIGVDGTSDLLPRQFPFNASRYFDHEEAQRIASGHVDMSPQGNSQSQNHRTSIASNTKVLSKLIPASAESNIATAVLVDRGLGLFGRVEHIVVPLLGGEDDYEALCLASCLARNTRCFVTILRVSSSSVNEAHQQDQHLSVLSHGRAHSQGPLNNRPLSPAPDISERHFEEESISHRSKEAPQDMVVPKDDSILFKKFFPHKPPSQGGKTQHQQTMERTGNHALEIIVEDDDELEEGIKVLPFQELSDAVQWARNCLTAQDLIVMGFDSKVSLEASSPNHQTPLTVGFSRVPSMEAPGEDNRLRPNTYPSSPTILERRGITLPSSSSQGESPISTGSLSAHQISESLQIGKSTPEGKSHSTLTPFSHHPRAGSEEARLGRSQGMGQPKSRSSSRGARSLSRGRKADMPGTGIGASHSHAQYAEPSLTTCQVMLGIAADKMIQSGVVSSLLVVRSRWFSQRKRHTSSSYDINTIGSSSPLSYFKPLSNTSHHHGLQRGSGDHRQNPDHILDKRWQYHSQQRQHHDRQHPIASHNQKQHADQDRDGVYNDKGHRGSLDVSSQTPMPSSEKASVSDTTC